MCIIHPMLLAAVCLLQLAACGVPVRWLNLQEYQSKKLMADHGIAVQRFEIIQSSEQAQDVCQRLSM